MGNVGATKSFLDIDLSLVRGKLGGMMGIENDDNQNKKINSILFHQLMPRTEAPGRVL